MPDEVVQPGEKQVGFLPEFTGERAGAGLKCLELCSDLGSFGGGKYLNRGEVPRIAMLCNNQICGIKFNRFITDRSPR